MAESSDTIIEERDELMVSSTGDSNPILRTAHFLKPSVTSINEPDFEFPPLSLSSLPPTFEPRNWPLKVKFGGWKSSGKYWRKWVDNMDSVHQSAWKNAGIYEAIMGSTYKFKRYDELVIGIAEKWCPESNTFIFPWGESTISLEDVLILGGYSVLGDYIYSPLETTELSIVEGKLLDARKEILKSKARKACECTWKVKFMESGSEIEHEAFLSFWLSKFVFRDSSPTIKRYVFPMATRLARGISIALGPAVLASIYRDLSLLKRTIVGLSQFSYGGIGNNRSELDLWSPFHLVQLWAWERFQELQPKPGWINNGEPRSARWHKVEIVKVENVRLALDSAAESFHWRPYAKAVSNWPFPKFYREKEEWVSVDLELDNGLQSFARFLKVSKLVGAECIEQYLPHRVGMQFGMDQDLPRCIAQIKETPEIAWRNYCKPTSDRKLYVPSRFFESDVTIRYLKWWKKSVLAEEDAPKDAVQQQRSLKTPKQEPQASKENTSGNDSEIPPGFRPKCKKVKVGDSIKKDKQVVTEMLSTCNEHDSCSNRQISSSKRCTGQSESFPASFADIGAVQKMESEEPRGSKGKKGGNDSNFPPGFHPKCYTAKAGNSIKGNKQTSMEMLNSHNKEDNLGYRPIGAGENFSSQSHSFPASFADNGAATKMESLRKSAEKITQIEVLTGRLDREDANGSKAGSLVSNRVNINFNEGEGSSHAHEIPGLALEARISRLEKLVAELKAERHFHI